MKSYFRKKLIWFRILCLNFDVLTPQYQNTREKLRKTPSNVKNINYTPKQKSFSRKKNCQTKSFKLFQDSNQTSNLSYVQTSHIFTHFQILHQICKVSYDLKFYKNTTRTCLVEDWTGTPKIMAISSKLFLTKLTSTPTTSLSTAIVLNRSCFRNCVRPSSVIARWIVH